MSWPNGSLSVAKSTSWPPASHPAVNFTLAIFEILTGDMIARAARRAGMDAELVFVVDNADPLRKVYPFLDPSYEDFIGHQLGSIPHLTKMENPIGNDSTRRGGLTQTISLLPFLDASNKSGSNPVCCQTSKPTSLESSARQHA